MDVDSHRARQGEMDRLDRAMLLAQGVDSLLTDKGGGFGSGRQSALSQPLRVLSQFHAPEQPRELA